MGIEEVKEEVIRNAKEKASAMIAQAKKEAARIMSEAERKLSEMREKSNLEAKKLIEAIKKQESATSELEKRKIALEAKKQTIENAFTEAKTRLREMDDKKRESTLKKLIEKAKSECEAEFIFCSSKDNKFFKGMKIDIVEITGGLIAENRERTIRVDYTFDTLLQSIKENELQHLSRILYG